MRDSLPADEYPPHLSTAIRHWTEHDFNAAATFLGTMERGPACDQSIHDFFLYFHMAPERSHDPNCEGIGVSLVDGIVTGKHYSRD